MTPELIVTGEARLPEQTNQRMAAILARACVGERLARHRAQPDCVVELRYANNASDVTTDPQNCSISRRSKSSLRTPSFDSPIGCAMTASLDPG